MLVLSTRKGRSILSDGGAPSSFKSMITIEQASFSMIEKRAVEF